MSGRRGRARRGVRTENVVQEEDPDNPRVIYRALRTACLGTLLKWDPAQNPRAGGDSSEGYLREPVGPLVIGFDTMLCVCPAGCLTGPSSLWHSHLTSPGYMSPRSALSSTIAISSSFYDITVTSLQKEFPFVLDLHTLAVLDSKYLCPHKNLWTKIRGAQF